MTDVRIEDLQQSIFDVVICGGGLAGLTLSRQLRRTHPTLKVLVAERTRRPIPEAAFKVGESCVELGSHYLESLGLRDYLRENHIFKFALRFYLGSGDLYLNERVEIGATNEPIIPSYQLDRGILENDLRAMVIEDGVILAEGVKVGVIDLNPGDELHQIELQETARPDDPADMPRAKVRVQARWLVDATGRASLLRKRMKLTRGTRHPGNASWFRIEGRLDLKDLVSDDSKVWDEAEWAPNRWRATNHLMGKGYWVWIIPLPSGHTSIGIVTHASHYSFDEIRTLEKSRQFLAEHQSVLGNALADRKVLDFGSLKGYSHNVARGWSADRWAIVGEAGAFVDPLYSPGTDFIAYANSFTGEMIETDLAGGDLVVRARELSALYRALVGGAVDIFREAADVYGHAEALLAKVYWDNLIYWSYPCQVHIQKLYRLKGMDLAEMIPLGIRFTQLTAHMQRLFATWASLVPSPAAPGFRGMPGFPSILIDAHIALQNELSAPDTFDYIRMRLAQVEEIAGEMLLRAMDEVGNAHVDELVDRAGVSEWGIRLSDSRVAATAAIGLARRRALRPLARDVERTLGRPPHNIDESTVRRLVGALIDPPKAENDVDRNMDSDIEAETETEIVCANSGSAGIPI